MAASADGRSPPAGTVTTDLFGGGHGSPEAPVTPASADPPAPPETTSQACEKTAVVLRPVEVTVLPDGSMRRADAARYLGLSLSRLNQWAHLRIGPRFIRVGRKTFYRKADLDRWKDAQASW